MSSLPRPHAANAPLSATASLPWIAVAAGLALLYLPTGYDLANGLWGTEQQGHAPIVLMVAAWLISRRWSALLALPTKPSRFAGGCCAAIALLSYVVGRSQDLPLFEVGSLIWLAAAVLLLMRGAAGLKLMAFPLLFMAFMVPLPGILVDAVTMPMKTAVSQVAETILYALGYPVARTGVILQVGQYQLLVADACAGLHTLFVLEAMGLLYLSVVPHPLPLRNIGLALLVVPVSFAANVVRVMVLCLITYHLGDAAGQGFLHGFAGIVLFLSALLLLIALDALFRSLVPAPPRPTKPTAAPAPTARALLQRVAAPGERTTGLMLLALCAGTAVAAWAARPDLAEVRSPPPLATLVPSAFAGWTVDRSVRDAVVINPQRQAELDKYYSDTLSRVYVNASGERVMLSLAYGANQSRTAQVHRPEVCYPAQGFTLRGLQKATLAPLGTPLPAYRMSASAGRRHEHITYWIRLGDQVVRGALEQAAARLRHGLAGELPDGLIFRVSQLADSAETDDGSWQVQDHFIADLLHALPAESQRFLIGQDVAP